MSKSAKYYFQTLMIKKVSLILKGIKQTYKKTLKQHKQTVMGGILLICATTLANILNFAFNAYLGRMASFEDIALVSFVAGLMSISRFSFSALSGSVNYKSAFLEGRFGEKESNYFWQFIRQRSLKIALAVSLVWIVVSPFLVNYFHTDSYWPILTFTLVWLTGFSAAVDRGFLSGKLLFGALAAAIAIEPIVKMITAVFFVQIQRPELLYLALPFSILSVYLLNFFFTKRVVVEEKISDKNEIKRFPTKYFVAQVISGVSSMLFLTLDVILAKHFLSAVDAGKYALISLNGKMIFFSGGLASQFLVPLVGRFMGKRQKTGVLFNYIFVATAFLTLMGFGVFGIFSSFTAPLLFGEKMKVVQPFLLPYAFAMMCIALARVFESYYLTKRLYLASLVTFILAIIQISLIFVFHQTIGSILAAVFVSCALYLIAMIAIHFNSKKVWELQKHIRDFFSKEHPHDPEHLRILIMNWRDTKHKWAGGAEVYIQELAKKWKKEGHHITIFCGNDGNSLRNQTVKGIKVVRRGGTFSVYIWAFLYYIFFFRKNTDVIIDCENGIPFFSPVYSRKPIYLVIHHIHQEVFSKHLKFPFAQIACLLEGKLMPYVYKNKRIITVSESTKKEVIKLGFSKLNSVTVVHNGIENQSIKRLSKSRFPLMSYLGRLKSYKNIDIAIHAFALIADKYPSLKFYIIGTGEEDKRLKKLVRGLQLSERILFLGKVSEKRKIELLSRSWFAVQPSMMEGWGITVIEANSCATPVVASRVNGLSDSIIDRKTGILVPLKDISSLSNAFDLLIENHKLRADMSIDALEWSRNFSWQRSADRFISIINQDLSSSELKRIHSPLFAMEAQLR